MQWYYYRDEAQHGPIDESEIRQLVEQGILTAEDLVWNDSLGENWVPVGSVATFLAAGPAVPALPETDSLATTASRGDTENVDLMQLARHSLQGNWGIAIGACLIYAVITNGLSAIPFIGPVFMLVVSGPLHLGLLLIFLTMIRGHEEPDINQLFKGFHYFLTAIAAYLLVTLFTLLWSLLFIIPGIIASLSYAMTFYIIADNPEIHARDAIAKSRAMMYGRRWKLFCLSLRFFGWFLLGAATCGIAFLFVIPYWNAAIAHFYEDIRDAPIISSH